MSVSSYSGENKEGCGKWLTTKGKTNPKSCIKTRTKPVVRKKQAAVFSSCSSSSNIFKPLITFASKDKSNNKKQSKINQFLEKKTKECSNGSVNHSSKVRGSITLSQNQETLLAREYEELWGSEGENESENDENNQNLKPRTICEETNKSSYPRLPVKSDSIVPSGSLTTISLKRVDVTAGEEDDDDAMLPTSKKFKKPESDIARTSPFCTANNDFQFTQWFQDQVDQFCRQSGKEVEKEFVHELFPSLSFLDRSSPKTRQSDCVDNSLVTLQFSEWFGQQMRALTQNSKHFLPQISSQSFDFTQWFEECLEVFQGSQNGRRQ